MYFPDYNPTLHDVYLYGPSNTGLPIGLNPNCILYACRNCYSAISLRNRGFNLEVTPVPPGTPTSLLPNYYNINSPLFKSKSERSVTVAVHYMANKPSDSKGGNPSTLAKYTGFSGPNPQTSLSFWKSDLSGFTSYGPWTTTYNCVPLEDAPETVGLQVPSYFTGSPEVPGFATGATFYQIAARDYGLMDLLPTNQQMTQTPLQNIHVYSILTQYQRDNLKDYVSSNSDTTISYFVPVNDVYVWDGIDKIIPVQYIGFSYEKTKNNQEPIANSLNYVTVYVLGGKPAVGDSSSPFLYKSGNTFYEFGQAYSASEIIISGVTYGYLAGPTTSGSVYPSYQFLEKKNLNKNHYRISNDTGITLASNYLFQNVNYVLNQLLDVVQNKYNEVSG